MRMESNLLESIKTDLDNITIYVHCTMYAYAWHSQLQAQLERGKKRINNFLVLSTRSTCVCRMCVRVQCIYRLLCTAVRDPSSWFHIFLRLCSRQLSFYIIEMLRTVDHKSRQTTIQSEINHPTNRTIRVFYSPKQILSFFLAHMGRHSNTHANTRIYPPTSIIICSSRHGHAETQCLFDIFVESIR